MVAKKIVNNVKPTVGSAFVLIPPGCEGNDYNMSANSEDELERVFNLMIDEGYLDDEDDAVVVVYKRCKVFRRKLEYVLEDISV